MKLLSELDSLDNVKDGNTRKIPTKTSDLTNDSGFITDTSNIAKLDTAQTFTKVNTFNAPTNIAGTEQATTKFMTANGGSLTIGKEGPNSGTMLKFCQVDGTPRLLFRSSSSVGAMVWSQPEAGAKLYIDLGLAGSDYHRIAMPATSGTLALTSQIPSLTNYVTKDGEETLTNKTLTAPKISSISNTGVLTLPTATGTLALTSDIPSVSNFLVASNIKAGTNISLSVSGNDVTINSTAGGGGTVTSVGITAGSGISVSNSPITTSGNITVNNTGVLSVNGGAGAITGIATTTQLATKAVQPYIQKSYGAGNGVRLIGTYNYSTSVGDTRPLFYLAGKQGHGNGVNYLWQGEFIFGVATTGAVTAKSILTISDGTFGKFYYRHDTVNKILYLYVYTGQYSSAYFSDLVQINAGNYSSYFTLASAGSVTTDTIIEGVNILYPASGGTMALTNQLLALGETSATAYRGDRGATAYTHSQLATGSNPHATTFANIASKPTTISGYGITDAAKTDASNITASTWLGALLPSATFNLTAVASASITAGSSKTGYVNITYPTAIPTNAIITGVSVGFETEENNYPDRVPQLHYVTNVTKTSARVYWRRYTTGATDVARANLQVSYISW